MLVGDVLKKRNAPDEPIHIQTELIRLKGRIVSYVWTRVCLRPTQSGLMGLNGSWWQADY